MQLTMEPQKLTVKKFQSLEKESQQKIFNQVRDWENTLYGRFPQQGQLHKEISGRLGLTVTMIAYLLERSKKLNLNSIEGETMLTPAKFETLTPYKKSTVTFMCKEKLRSLFSEKFKPAAISKIMSDYNLSEEMADKMFMETFYRKREQ